MNSVMGLIVAVATFSAAAAGQTDLKALDRGCAEVQKTYPLLMLAVMAEGPMNCGTHTGDYVDCDAGDSPEQAATRAKRLMVRKRQEAVFQRASAACELYVAHRGLASAQHAAATGLALAREVGTDLPKELKDRE